MPERKYDVRQGGKGCSSYNVRMFMDLAFVLPYCLPLLLNIQKAGDYKGGGLNQDLVNTVATHLIFGLPFNLPIIVGRKRVSKGRQKVFQKVQINLQVLTSYI